MALAALRVLAGRLRRCASLVETLSLHDVDRRLARLLLTEAVERGRRSGAGFDIDFTYTHQQLASRIGSVREVVSRALSRLQQAKLIRVEGKVLRIHEESAFREFVEGD
jgi:CRP/FNR family transcriptional regulator